MTDLSQRLRTVLVPHFQELDGLSRLDEVDRIARIARQFHEPASEEEARAFELLLLFHVLGSWLEKMGNLSRVVLSMGGVVDERELRQTAGAIRRLDDPTTPAERAVAAAILIDTAGLRGLAERFSRARREGSSVTEVAREALTQVEIPEWMPREAATLWTTRRAKRAELAQAILDEL